MPNSCKSSIFAECCFPWVFFFFSDALEAAVFTSSTDVATRHFGQGSQGSQNGISNAKMFGGNKF